ncbi:DUF4271 domain-containing protein [Lacihabitans soyangensis]|uniref:DUF4271 domain-containing protein n=1 Tax=Lacihabitans soyangensis TaxID=869394 RepID=UPI0020CD4627|nr:DUF4271 domain-containing protein [Lacihabitans soyangensis]
MRYLFLLLISFVFFPTIAALPSGPENKYNIVYNFEKDWTEYDQDLKVYTPYIAKNNNDSKVFSLKINLNDYPGGYLVIKTPKKGNFLFFDNHLKRTLPDNKWVVYSIRQLIQEINRGETVLSIFGSNLPEENTVFIGFPAAKTTEVITKAKSSFLNLIPRSTEHMSSSLVFVFFINVIMLSFIATNYTKAFKKYYSFKDLTAFIPKENSFLVNKPMDRPNMMFIIMVSLISGFIVMLSHSNGLNLFEENFFFQSGNTFGILTTNFFKVCLLFFISYIVKYFYINLIAKLFNIRKIVDIHYFKIIQTTIYYFTLVLILLLIGYNTHLNLNLEFKYLFTSILIVFYFLRTVLIYFTINRTGNIKTLYLISYLCIVEVFPIVLGIRILL